MAASAISRAWTGVLVGVMLAGCIPGRFEGYRPSGEGRRESGACVAGVRDVLRMPAAPGVDILLRAAKDRDHTILLDASVVVPDGIVVRLAAPQIAVGSDEWPARLLAIVRITGNGREHRPLDELNGAGTYEMWFDGGGALWRTDVPAARRFTVELPALEIQGRRFQPERVAFERYSEWGMFTCAQ